MINKDVHTAYIRKTFSLALKGAGSVSPNPLVGALIVKDGRIIAQGFHSRFGSHHAEIDAINNASEEVRGATLYVNLEPCSHTEKKTPPCVPRIIKEGISEVVISTIDPNPRQQGEGIRQLKGAGIKVVTGVLENEGKELNKFFFKFMTKRLPYITLKIAQTINGFITQAVNKQIWISSEKSQILVHRWRSQYDAVLVGANTVLVDNPKLTVRKVNGRNPKRIILDGDAKLSEGHCVFDAAGDTETHLFVSESNAAQTVPLARKGIIVHALRSGANSKIAPELILEQLAQSGIMSILVEGGSDVFSQFLSVPLWDELKIFVAPKLWTSGVSFTTGLAENVNNLNLNGVETYDDDVLLSYKRGLI